MTLPAYGAPEDVAAAHSVTLERKLVGALFIWNTQVPTGLPPFLPMRGNPAMGMAVIGNQMSQFMQQGLSDILF